MKKLFMPLIAVILLLGVVDNPVMAQPAANEKVGSTETDRNDDNSDDYGDKWGLLGLLGLIGLAGLRKTDKTTRYTSNPQNR